MTRRIILLAAIALSAGIASPAAAGHHWRHRIVVVPYWPAHHAIYAMKNNIAYLEADPDADEDYKGPAIRSHHAEIKRLQAAIGPRPPKYFTPCCYSRRPIRLR